jgi:hypothetical protein
VPAAGLTGKLFSSQNKFMNRLVKIILLAACLNMIQHTFAGPPLITDDPDTQGPNNLEIDIATTSEYTQPEWNLETPLPDIHLQTNQTCLSC